MGQAAAARIGVPLQLCYARVVRDGRPPRGAPLYRVAVQAGGCVEEVLSSQVYWFRAEGPEGGPVVGMDSPGAPSTDTSSAPLIDTAGPSSVDAAEVVGAVGQMLAAAGLRLDAEAGDLMQRVVALQQQLEQSERQRQTAEEEARTQNDEAERIRSSWTCRICLTRPVDAVVRVCGHVLCWQCASSLQGRCAFCRKTATGGVAKLYN